MKKPLFISLFLFAVSVASFAQDYEVESVIHLPDAMEAKINSRPVKPNSQQKCALLQIATQNISPEDRSLFDFDHDLGSSIAFRIMKDGQWNLWVSPKITTLVIKSSNLGELPIYFPDYLEEEIESGETYRIKIVGLRETKQETVSHGKSQLVFRPYPEDAMIYINGESLENKHEIFTLPGTYKWKAEHPLYHTANGSHELSIGKSDTIYVNLVPAYGYMKILDAIGIGDDGEELEVYVDGEHKGQVPYQSDKLKEGFYDVELKAGDTLLAQSSIEVREHQISVNQADELCLNYAHENGLDADSTYKPKQTRFYPITGSTSINCIPQATVVIDSVNYGLTPVVIENLAVGHHQLKLSATGYTPLTQDITIAEEKETPYYLKLNRLCRATIVTDEEGDIIHVDGKYVGRTPVTIERPFGNYIINITRIGRINQDVEVTLSPDEPEPTLDFSFGQHVNIETGNKKCKLYLDGNYIGRSPMDLYVYNGTHTISAERGWKKGEKGLNIPDGMPNENINLELRTQKPRAFLQRGAFFLTGHVGLIKGGSPVYGINIGDIAKGGQAGWFLSLTTSPDFVYQLIDGDFSLLNAYHLADGNGQVQNGIQPTYSGERSTLRASALFGVALNVAGPVYLRIAAGYGIRHYGWKTVDAYSEDFIDTGYWVLIDPLSWQHVETSLGLQCCIYNFVVNADVLFPPTEVLTNNKKLFEFRVGLGFCLKHKK